MKHISILAMAGLLFTFAAHADYTKEGANEWMKYTTPGEGHKVLKHFVGNYKTTTKFWMEPNTKAEESKGTSSNKLILGGRYLQSDFKGTAMGKPFQGMGLMGFDALKAEYQSTWIDTMSTAIMISTGTYDAATKTLNDSGTGSDAMSGEKDKWYRSEYKVGEKGNYTLSMYTKDKAGTEFKTMEIDYKKH